MSGNCQATGAYSYREWILNLYGYRGLVEWARRRRVRKVKP